MRNIYFKTFFFLTTIFLSCDKEKQVQKVSCTQRGEYDYLNNYVIDSLCTEKLCLDYQDIWKQLFLEKNNLTEAYFNKHVELCESNIHDWNEGVSFSICYKIKIDWAIAYHCDQFIIKIKAENNYYPALNLPRNSYLTKESIKVAISGHAFSSDIIKLSNMEALKFNSMEKALKYLINKAEVSTLCTNGVFINESTGNLMLEATGQYENEVNKCIQGQIDLMNTEVYISESPCFID
jgi:hypothetical protein